MQVYNPITYSISAHWSPHSQVCTSCSHCCPCTWNKCCISTLKRLVNNLKEYALCVFIVTSWRTGVLPEYSCVMFTRILDGNIFVLLFSLPVASISERSVLGGALLVSVHHVERCWSVGRPAASSRHSQHKEHTEADERHRWGDHEFLYYDFLNCYTGISFDSMKIVTLVSR